MKSAFSTVGALDVEDELAELEVEFDCVVVVVFAVPVFPAEVFPPPCDSCWSRPHPSPTINTIASDAKDNARFLFFIRFSLSF